MTETTTTLATSGSAWTDLAATAGMVMSVALNGGAADAGVALRLLLANGSSAMILPGNLLPALAPHRPAVGGLSLAAGDKLQAMSDQSATWTVTHSTTAGYSSAVASSTAGAWADLKTGPGTVRLVLASAYLPAEANLRILRNDGTTEAPLMSNDDIADYAGARRWTDRIALAAGEKLQVMSDVPMDWIATGVSA